MFQHEAQGAGGSVLAGEVMVIEVHPLRLVHAAYVDNRDRGVVQLFLRWITPNDGGTVFRNENTDGQKVVFVSAAGMREDCANHGPAFTTSPSDVTGPSMSSHVGSRAGRHARTSRA